MYASVIANNERITFFFFEKYLPTPEKEVNLYLLNVLAYLMCDVLCVSCHSIEIPSPKQGMSKSKNELFSKTIISNEASEQRENNDAKIYMSIPSHSASKSQFPKIFDPKSDSTQSRSNSLKCTATHHETQQDTRITHPTDKKKASAKVATVQMNRFTMESIRQ